MLSSIRDIYRMLDCLGIHIPGMSSHHLPGFPMLSWWTCAQHFQCIWCTPFSIKMLCSIPDIYRYSSVCTDEPFYNQPNPGFCSGTSCMSRFCTIERFMSGRTYPQLLVSFVLILKTHRMNHIRRALHCNTSGMLHRSSWPFGTLRKTTHCFQEYGVSCIQTPPLPFSS